MKVRIEISPGMTEPEVVIWCDRLDETVINLQHLILEQEGGRRCLALHKGETEYYVPMDEIYFFETQGRSIYAHTANELFETEYKLYELEELLSASFLRISKSTIANLDVIYSITRNLTASSVVEFAGSNKRAMVSRSYYKVLVERLRDRRMKSVKKERATQGADRSKS